MMKRRVRWTQPMMREEKSISSDFFTSLFHIPLHQHSGSTTDETCWYLNAKNNLSNGGQVKCAGSTTVSSSALNGLKLSHLETFKCWSRIYLFNFFSKAELTVNCWPAHFCLFFTRDKFEVRQRCKICQIYWFLVPGIDSFNLSVFWQSELLWKIHMRMFYLTPCLTLSATTRPSNVCLSING